ncbi:DUF3575 domain-containing protein [uncultured Mediterranea sp.]|uniref:DUF3575 domain-containing protein n=1 Tax=uncultured Mediterranea sp. TaxID=1926662 RepID=UPI00258E19DF|nr:DUF3575 domain-containing protein [uncultured Mediterranea sp.]
MILLMALNDTYAQQTTQKKQAEDESLTFKERWGFKTNAVDWLLTVPNLGVEFDLGNSVRTKRTLSANVKWNWETSQKYNPSLILNLFDGRIEWRQYFRTRQRNALALAENPSLWDKLNFNVFTTKRKNPRTWRAYYWGVYANAASYSFKISKRGIQGKAVGAGISLGFTAPLYGYRQNYIDLEMGGSFGLLYTRYDIFEYDAESDCYPRIADKCKGGHLVPFPVITDLRIAFVYRFVSVKDKYKQSITRRIDRINEKRARLNEKINQMRARIDSIQTVYSKQGQAVPDSLLSREEQEEWQKMQREALEKKLEKEQEALRQQMMDSLGIHPTDSTPLTKDQEKAIRKALKEYKEKQEEAEKLRQKQAEDVPMEETPQEEKNGQTDVEAAFYPDRRRKGGVA